MLSTSAFFTSIDSALYDGCYRFRRPQNEHIQQLTQLMVYITLPALILFSLHTTFSIRLLIDFTWLVIMSIFVQRWLA